MRNPLCALDSYWNFVLSGSHTSSLLEQEYARLQLSWDAMLQRETEVWRQFHQYWLSTPVPLLVVGTRRRQRPG